LLPIALLLLAACGKSGHRASSPQGRVAAGQPVGTIDFAQLHQAEDDLLQYALERPVDSLLLHGAWFGLVREAKREGIGDGTAQPPLFTGKAAADNSAFDDAFAALRTTRSTTPDPSALNGAAINAMTMSLNDTHTAYLPPGTFDQANNELNGRPTSETGLRLEPQGQGALLVVEVLPGSPAERAGLLPGDSVVAIDGQPVGTLDIRQRQDLVETGKDGTKLSFDIRRPGYARVRTFTLTRQATPVDLISVTTLPGDVGYIRLRVFATGAAVETRVRDALAQFQQEGTRGVVFDLRGDPGGSLQTLDVILSRFVDHSPLLYQQQRGGRPQPVPRISSTPAFGQPYVVLVDGGSASSSEVFAAAVQEYHTGTVLGTPTCGCIVGALFFSLVGGAGIEIGVARVLSPVTMTDHEHNPIQPDALIPPDPAALRDGRDNQLEAALQILGVAPDVARIAAPVARDAD
jgi:carboxyl-terminal processing protease